MKAWQLVGVAALAAGAAAGGIGWQHSARAQEPVTWLSDYAAGEKLARESGKPLFVAFRCER